VAKTREPSQPCVVSSNSVSSNREVAVVVVSAKDGRAFEVAKLSDGSYRVTRITNAGAGVEAGVGAGVSVTVADHRYGGYVGADAGVGLEFRAGEVYYAKDGKELKQLVDEELEDTVEDGLLGNGPARFLWEGGQDIAGAVTGQPDHEFGIPDEIYAEGGVVVNASAEATSLVNSAAASAAESEGLGVRTTKDGKTTVYLRTTTEDSAELQQFGLDTEGFDFSAAGGQGWLELLTAVTFDSSGHMIDVSTQAISGTTLLSAGLPIKDTTDRSLALAFLAASGVGRLGGPQAQLITTVPGAFALTEFQKAAAERGTVTRQHLTTETGTDFAVDAAGKIEVELGLSADVSTTQLTSTGGEYWDGTQWQTWTGCAA
jgi:hypothetical protein